MQERYQYVTPDYQQVLDGLAENLMEQRRAQFAQLLGQQPTAQVYDFPVPVASADIAPIIA